MHQTKVEEPPTIFGSEVAWLQFEAATTDLARDTALDHWEQYTVAETNTVVVVSEVFFTTDGDDTRFRERLLLRWIELAQTVTEVQFAFDHVPEGDPLREVALQKIRTLSAQ